MWLSRQMTSSISIFYSKGDGTFYQATIIDPGQAVGGISVGDFNGDGKIDLAGDVLRWREFLGSESSSYVFPSPRDPSSHFQDYKTAWRTAVKKAGLADRRAYDLRSTFASRANVCHATGMTVAHLLGHASTQILPTTYVQSTRTQKPLSKRWTLLVSTEIPQRALSIRCRTKNARFQHQNPGNSYHVFITVARF